MEPIKPNESTQQKHPWKATIRTTLQVVVGLAVLMPIVANEVSAEFPELAGYFAIPVGIAAVITRLMATDTVEKTLARIFPWLSTGAEKDADQS